MKPVYMPAGTIAAVVAGFEALGVNAEELCARAQVEREALAEGTDKVPLVWLQNLWAAGSTYVEGPDYAARVGMSVPFGSLGVLDYLFASAPTVNASLTAVAARSSGLASRFSFRFRPEEGFMEIVGSPDPLQQGSEFALALVVNRSRTLSARDPQVEAVGLPLPEFAGRPHEKTYKTRVVYDTSSAWVRFNVGGLQAPVREADPTLFKTLDRLADKLDIGPNAPHFEAAVRRSIASRLAERDLSAIEVAGAIGLSERSFYRRLSEAGTSFRSLVDETRAAEAERRLMSGASVAAVAYDLGYADQPAFSRAFRRWRGESPAKWLECVRAKTTD